MTTTAELVEMIKTALSTDEALTAWCQQTFGKSHKVCIDVDEKKPPNPESDYPVIAITAIRHRRGESSREIAWEVELGVGVLQREIVIDGNCITMTGFIQAETLRELAEDAIYKTVPINNNSNGESGSISIYPLFISGSVLPLKTIRTSRHGMPG